jgi:Acyl-coenzyme A:6-aminopenicillanic acid acyl-transferase
MNEYGLTVGMAAVDDGVAVRRPGAPVLGSLAVIRLALDTTRTVDEAIVLFSTYEIDFTGGPPLHYLIADASGASAVVEFVDGRRVVTRGGPPWQALTNFRLAGADSAVKGADRRYATAQATLDARAGALDWQRSLDLLRVVAQPHTQWSVTYEPRSGAVHLVARQDWGSVHEFTLPMDLT